MMSMAALHAIASFALVAGLLTIIPGLDTALVLRTVVTHGPAPAFATAGGIATGSLVWGIGAAAGVTALLTASHVAYTVLRVGGAVYLIWLGVGMLRAAVRRPDRSGSASGSGSDSRSASASASEVPLSNASTTSRPDGDPSPGLLQAWSRGLTTNVLNPKIGVFYIAMLPQFIPAGTSHLAMGAVLALVHDAEGLIWFTAIILTAQTARRLLNRPSVQRGMDAITGAVLVGFGLRLAAERA